MKKPAKPARRNNQPAAAIPRKTPPPPPDDARTAGRSAFPIVGIGASAGALEALELFLKNVPDGNGMAFVIVQHLDPTHKGIMAELLQRQRPAGGGQRTELETTRLVHELQVHHIELEMQNEEIKTSRTELAAGLALYADLYDFAPTGYLTFDREGVIRLVNLTGARLLGVERSRLVKRRFGQFVAESDRRTFSDFLQKVFASQAKECCEVTLLQEGSQPLIVWIEGTRSAAEQECCAVVLDITARKRAEEALRASEVRYRRLFESAKDGILILNAETGMVVDVNPFLVKLLGYSREAFLGKKVWELGFFKDIAANQANFAELQQKGYVRYEDQPLETADGRRIEVEFVSNVYQVDHKNVMQCNIRDITERNQAAEKMRRMATVVRDSNDAITIQDFEGRITAWNRGAELMYGYSEAEAFQMNMGRLTAPSKVEEQNDFTRRLMAGETVTSFETQRVTKDGRILAVWLTVTKLMDDAGKPIGIASTERDITVRKRAAAEVHKLNAELEQRVVERTAQLEAANKELESFSYSVSHDLRAPLRHVQGYVDMLAREAEGQLSDRGRRYMKTIADVSREMGVLIDDLLAFSRMGRAEMIETMVNLDSLVQDTLCDLEPATRERNIVWKIPPLPAVQADPAMLKLALTNLLGNAVKFTRPRNPAEIEIGCDGMEGERVIVFVRDNGVGFDPQYAHKLFGVFQRLHRVDEFEGTGIGLANVRRIIARQGGRTWAEGKLNEGATFYFTLKGSAVQP